MTSNCSVRKGKRECIYPEPAKAKDGDSVSTIAEVPEATEDKHRATQLPTPGKHSPYFTRVTAIGGGYLLTGGQQYHLSVRVRGPPRRGKAILPRRRLRARPWYPSITNHLTVPEPETHPLGVHAANLLATPEGSPPETSLTSLSPQSGGPPFDDSHGDDVEPLTAETRARIRNLPETEKFYVHYYRTGVSHHHYGLQVDRGSLLRAAMLNHAMSDDALYNAVIAFAAYLFTVSKDDGEMQDFLPYYSKALTGLRNTLQQKKAPTLTSLMTMLQLALLEVSFLGV